MVLAREMGKGEGGFLVGTAFEGDPVMGATALAFKALLVGGKVPLPESVAWARA